MHFALSINYLKFITQCLEPKIFNDKVEGLLHKIEEANKTSTFSLNILGFRPCVMTFKYLFDRTKSRRLIIIFFCFVSHLVLLSINPENSVSYVTIKVQGALFKGIRYLRIFKQNKIKFQKLIYRVLNILIFCSRDPLYESDFCILNRHSIKR